MQGCGNGSSKMAIFIRSKMAKITATSGFARANKKYFNSEAIEMFNYLEIV